jgi:hypothetical protein
MTVGASYNAFTPVDSAGGIPTRDVRLSLGLTF